MVEIKAMLKEAIFRTDQQPIGQIFRVKDLFTGTEWAKLSAGEKRQLGILYSNEYKNNQIHGVKKIDNNKQHHCVYKKL